MRWSNETKVDYFNLSPGTYEFKLRSKKKKNVISPLLEAPAISICGPWFLNRIAISIYATFAVDFAVYLTMLIIKTS